MTGQILRKETKKILRYDFTIEERREIADSMAQSVAELHQAEDEKKAVMSDFKSKIDSITASVNNAASKLNNGYEIRPIKCERIQNFKEGIVVVKRLDTGEQVSSRRMTDDERQMILPGTRDTDDADGIPEHETFNETDEGEKE